MKLFHLKTEQWIPRKVEDLFPFFANAKNLEELTPPWLHFRVVNAPAELKEGSKIDYRLSLRGIPFRWQSEIAWWDPPYSFVDLQTRGPYRVWRHEHQFEPRNGGTLMRDNVEYAVLGGALVQKLFVAPDLKRIFRYRRDRLTSIFGGNE